jgi:hypothetical protein
MYTLHMPLVTLPTAASVFQLAAAKTVGTVIDVAMVHEFHGSVDQIDRHGQPCHPNPDKVLIDQAVTKVQGNEYRLAWV